MTGVSPANHTKSHPTGPCPAALNEGLTLTGTTYQDSVNRDGLMHGRILRRARHPVRWIGLHPVLHVQERNRDRASLLLPHVSLFSTMLNTP